MIGKEPSEDLLNFCFVTINKALFEMSQNRAEEDRKILANILMNDLNAKFHRLTLEDVTKAFHNGVREADQMAINPRTWFNWLNKQKLKANAVRIESSQENERLMIEQKCQEIDRKQVLREFIELCLIEVYEQYVAGEKFKFQGVSQVFNWCESVGLISLTLKEKEKLWDEIQEEIKQKKKFVHNERKKFHPVIMCREKTLMTYFSKWRKQKFDLRTEANRLL